MTHTANDILQMKTRLDALRRDYATARAALPAAPALQQFAWAAAGEDPAAGPALFAKAMEAEGAPTKESYLALRDRIRAALRAAEVMQRAHRRAELELRGAVEHESTREWIYMARIQARATITALIAMRHAGKAWSRAARAEAVASAA